MEYVTDLSRLGTTFENGKPIAFVVSPETNRRVANGGWPKQRVGTRLALYHVALMAFPDVPDEAAVVFHDRDTLFEYLELRKEYGHEKTLAAMKGARYGGNSGGLFGVKHTAQEILETVERFGVDLPEPGKPPSAYENLKELQREHPEALREQIEGNPEADPEDE